MRKGMFLFFILTWTMLFSPADAAIITGEWKELMMSDLNLKPLEFSRRVLACFEEEETVTVYLGPGEQYALLAENVETDDLYGVAGLIGKWALVDTGYGVGYVNTNNMQDKPKVGQLHFAHITITAPNDCCMLKNAAEAHHGGYLAVIPEGEKLILLSVCDNFVYAEANVDDKPVRGFLARDDYSFMDWKHELRKAGFFAGFDIDLGAGFGIDLWALYTEQYAVHKKDSVAVGDGYTVGVRRDGTCVAKGLNDRGQCNVEDWQNIVAVSAGIDHTVGLRADGTVVAVGNNDNGKCEVQDWDNIVAISAGHMHTVGLRADRRVVVTGDNAFHEHDLSGWWHEDEVVAISAGANFTLGLTTDGRVLRGGGYTDEAYFLSSGAENRASITTSDWREIVSVSAGGWHAVALNGDGTICGAGETCSGQLDDIPDWEDVVEIAALDREGIAEIDTSDWENIVEIAASPLRTFGLTADGNVIGTPFAGTICTGWQDVVFMDASDSLLVGVKTDGTVVTQGDDTWEYPIQDLSDWTDIGLATDAKVF